MDLSLRTIYAREAFLHMSFEAMGLTLNYVPFVGATAAGWRWRFEPSVAISGGVFDCAKTSPDVLSCARKRDWTKRLRRGSGERFLAGAGAVGWFVWHVILVGFRPPCVVAGSWLLLPKGYHDVRTP